MNTGTLIVNNDYIQIPRVISREKKILSIFNIEKVYKNFKLYYRDIKSVEIMGNEVIIHTLYKDNFYIPIYSLPDIFFINIHRKKIIITGSQKNIINQIIKIIIKYIGIISNYF